MGINFNSNYQNVGLKPQNVKPQTADTNGVQNEAKVETETDGIVRETTTKHTSDGLTENRTTCDNGDTIVEFTITPTVEGDIATHLCRRTLHPKIRVTLNNPNKNNTGLSMINNDVVAAELAAKFPKNKFM